MRSTLRYAVQLLTQCPTSQCVQSALNDTDSCEHCVCYRYAVQLLTPAKVVVQTNGREEIGKEDIEEIDSLFYDAKSSAKLLAEQKAGYLQ